MGWSGDPQSVPYFGSVLLATLLMTNRKLRMRVRLAP